MTLQQFTEMTLQVIRDDGMGDYLPTLLYPETQEIRVVEGIPDGVDHREAIQDMVRRSGGDKREFLFGVCSEPGRITAGHFRPGQKTEFMEIIEGPEGYITDSLDSCEWWGIS